MRSYLIYNKFLGKSSNLNCPISKKGVLGAGSPTAIWAHRACLQVWHCLDVGHQAGRPVQYRAGTSGPRIVTRCAGSIASVGSGAMAEPVDLVVAGIGGRLTPLAVVRWSAKAARLRLPSPGGPCPPHVGPGPPPGGPGPPAGGPHPPPWAGTIAGVGSGAMA